MAIKLRFGGNVYPACIQDGILTVKFTNDCFINFDMPFIKENYSMACNAFRYSSIMGLFINDETITILRFDKTYSTYLKKIQLDNYGNSYCKYVQINYGNWNESLVTSAFTSIVAGGCFKSEKLNNSKRISNERGLSPVYILKPLLYERYSFECIHNDVALSLPRFIRNNNGNTMQVNAEYFQDLSSMRSEYFPRIDILSNDEYTVFNDDIYSDNQNTKRYSIQLEDIGTANFYGGV